MGSKVRVGMRNSTEVDFAEFQSQLCISGKGDTLQKVESEKISRFPALVAEKVQMS